MYNWIQTLDSVINAKGKYRFLLSNYITDNHCLDRKPWSRNFLFIFFLIKIEVIEHVLKCSNYQYMGGQLPKKL